MLAKKSKRTRRKVAVTALALAGVLAAPTAAGAAPTTVDTPSVASVRFTSVPTAPVAVGYKCFVTFPGGSNVVDLGYTFEAGAVSFGSAGLLSRAVVKAPVITPNPQYNTQVRNVVVAYRLPANARLSAWWTSGGSNLGAAGATVRRSGDVLHLTAPGPFPAGAPFQLPALNFTFLSTSPGPVEVTTGGVDFDRPSFSWTLTDHYGSERPLACNPPAPVVFTRTTAGA